MKVNSLAAAVILVTKGDGNRGAVREMYGERFPLSDLNAADLFGDTGTQKIPELVVA